MTVSNSPATRRAPLWRHRSFMLLWSGQSVSVMGTAVTSIALPMTALTTLHASAFQVGALAALGQLPTLLVALPAGALVDRMRKKPVMLACDVGRAVLLASVPLAAALGVLNMAQLFSVAFLSAALGVFFDAAYQSYVPLLVPSDRLMEANGKIGTVEAFSQFAGPSAGGSLVAVLGGARTIGFDSLSFAVSAIFLGLIKDGEKAVRASGSTTGLRAEIAAGLRFVLRHSVIRSVVLCNGAISYFLAMVTTAWIVYVVRELGWSPSAAGLVLGISSLGGVVGGIVAKRLVDAYGIPRVLLGAVLAYAPGELSTIVVPKGVTGQIVVTLAFTLLITAVVIYNVAQRTLRQLLCPPEMLGRTNASARWLQWGFMPLGSLTAGAVSSWAGSRTTLLVCVVGLAAAAALLHLSPVRTASRSLGAESRELQVAS
ncbi:MFS transporter [Kitasatospora sp. NPDC057692]|uniref:MFS transporter n=1 Tax=Kitasatospora sp. NPDC057692 TaxID=3346215 RepID=UPI0036B818AB